MNNVYYEKYHILLLYEKSMKQLMAYIGNIKKHKELGVIMEIICGR